MTTREQQVQQLLVFYRRFSPKQCSQSEAEKQLDDPRWAGYGSKCFVKLCDHLKKKHGATPADVWREQDKAAEPVDDGEALFHQSQQRHGDLGPDQIHRKIRELKSEKLQIERKLKWEKLVDKARTPTHRHQLLRRWQPRQMAARSAAAEPQQVAEPKLEPAPAPDSRPMTALAAPEPASRSSGRHHERGCVSAPNDVDFAGRIHPGEETPEKPLPSQPLSLLPGSGSVPEPEQEMGAKPKSQPVRGRQSLEPEPEPEPEAKLERTSTACLLENADLQHLHSRLKEEDVTYQTLLSASPESRNRLADLMGLTWGQRQRLGEEVDKARGHEKKLVDSAVDAVVDGRTARPTNGDDNAAISVGTEPVAMAGFKSSFAGVAFDDIEKISYISKGASGAVYRAKWENMHCAVKVFECNRSDPNVIETFRTELFLMKNLLHDNLVRFYAFCEDPPAIITELLVGNLSSLLYGKNSQTSSGEQVDLTDKRQLLISVGIANGLAFLHKHDVCHRDLKSPNVLYDRDLKIKLCDFAFSRFKEKSGNNSTVKMQSRVGTPAWMAPEVLRGEEYSRSADIYSYGVILWEMVTREEPFKGINAFAIAFQVGSDEQKLQIPEDCAPVWRHLMTLCWSPPLHRPTIANIVQMLRSLRDDVASGGCIKTYQPCD